MIQDLAHDIQLLKEENEMMSYYIESMDHIDSTKLAIQLYEQSEISLQESANGDINAIFKQLSKDASSCEEGINKALSLCDFTKATKELNRYDKLLKDALTEIKKIDASDLGSKVGGFFRSFGRTIAAVTANIVIIITTRKVLKMYMDHFGKDKDGNPGPVTGTAKIGKDAMLTALMAAQADFASKLLADFRERKDIKDHLGDERSGNLFKDQMVYYIEKSIEACAHMRLLLKDPKYRDYMRLRRK